MRGIADESAGWASAHSVPYLLTLVGDTLVAERSPGRRMEYRRVVSTGTVDGLAADVTWTPDDAGIRSNPAAETVVSLVRDADDEITIAIGDGLSTIPYSGRPPDILDGPALEVASAGGVFGSLIFPQGDTP